MKTKIIIITAIILFSFLNGKTQPPENRRENIEALKAAYITREMGLTPQESQTFWPVYNQYQDEIEKIRKEKNQQFREGRRLLEKLSDVDLEKMVDNEIVFQQRELDVRKKFHSEFKKVLPIRKVALLYKAEEDFKKEILKRIREERQSPKD